MRQFVPFVRGTELSHKAYKAARNVGLQILRAIYKQAHEQGDNQPHPYNQISCKFGHLITPFWWVVRELSETVVDVGYNVVAPEVVVCVVHHLHVLGGLYVHPSLVAVVFERL